MTTRSRLSVVFLFLLVGCAPSLVQIVVFENDQIKLVQCSYAQLDVNWITGEVTAAGVGLSSGPEITTYSLFTEDHFYEILSRYYSDVSLTCDQSALVNVSKELTQSMHKCTKDAPFLMLSWKLAKDTVLNLAFYAFKDDQQLGKLVMVNTDVVGRLITLHGIGSGIALLMGAGGNSRILEDQKKESFDALKLHVYAIGSNDREASRLLKE